MTYAIGNRNVYTINQLLRKAYGDRSEKNDRLCVYLVKVKFGKDEQTDSWCSMEGPSIYSDGLHQAIEATGALMQKVEAATQTFASCYFLQNYLSSCPRNTTKTIQSMTVLLKTGNR